jgi:hypothetical protein
MEYKYIPIYLLLDGKIERVKITDDPRPKDYYESRLEKRYIVFSKDGKDDCIYFPDVDILKLKDFFERKFNQTTLKNEYEKNHMTYYEKTLNKIENIFKLNWFYKNAKDTNT